MRTKRKAGLGLAAGVAIGIGVFGFTGTAAADVILAPVSPICNISCPGFGSLADTINQNGLSIGYTSGVTDFDAYLALNPTHTTTFDGFEWFSNEFSNTAQVTYDLGGLFNINRLALWNEEASGIGLLSLFHSTDGMAFGPLALGLLPTDNPPLADYPADVFAFGPVNTRFVRFDMSGCPQPNPGSFVACGIGEVAFAVGDAQQVPEPALMELMVLGLAGVAAGRRGSRS